LSAESGGIDPDTSQLHDALGAAAGLTQNQQQAEAARQQAQKQATRDKIASIARGMKGDASYAFGAKKDEFASGTNKCNKFVGDVVKKAGAQAMVIDPKTGKPIPIAPGSTTPRPPTAGEWADPKTNIPNWRPLNSGESPERGDVAAFAMPGHASYTGHSGIVTSVDSNGTVHAMAAHGYGVGPDSAFQPSIASFRRYDPQ